MGVNALLDTHVFVWCLTAPERLSQAAREVIDDPHTTLWLSSATAWELATKYRLGKLPQAAVLIEEFERHAHDLEAELLVMDHRHAIKAGLCGVKHKDPFDRMLAAQAQCEDLTLISRDETFKQFDIRLLW